MPLRDGPAADPRHDGHLLDRDRRRSRLRQQAQSPPTSTACFANAATSLPDKDDDFRVIDMKQISDTVSGTLRMMTALVAAIASISLIVGGIGIVNIMLVSVTERTREIGIRLAIGALAREVRLQFLTEAVVLCSLGGVIGILLSFGLSLCSPGSCRWTSSFNPLINLGSLLFSSFLGILFGYVPAQRAAALNPIDALRHE